MIDCRVNNIHILNGKNRNDAAIFAVFPRPTI